MRALMMRWMVPIGLALALAAAVAAPARAAPVCGDTTGTPASGTPIVLGAITGKTGPDDFSSATRAATAFFACVNANGGIHGRPIRYEVADDQWNPELAAQLAAKLVNDRQAIAMVGNSSFVECGANAGLYAASGIAVIAGVGVPRECFYSRDYVPVNAGPRVSMVAAMLYAAQSLHAKSFACVGPNIPGVGDWGCDGVTKLGAQLGYPVQTVIMDPGSADFTSVVLQAAASRPNAIILGLPKGLTVPLLQAAAEQGLVDTTAFLSAASAYDLSVPAAIGSVWDNKFYANMEFNSADSKSPDNANWRAVMDQYGKAGDPRDTFSQGGYLAARIATQVLLGLPPATVTRQSFFKAIAGMGSFSSDILCAPWYFDADAVHHNPNSTTRMAVSKAGGWQVISGCERSKDPDLADIRAYESKIGLTK